MPKLRATNLFEKIVGFIEKYFPDKFISNIDSKLELTGIPLSASEYTAIMLIILIIATPFALFLNIIAGLIVPVAIIGVMIFLVPSFIRSRRITEIEKSLPDVFHEMALTLRAGVAIEGAMDDIATADYGPISEEYRKALLEIRRGRPIEKAFIGLERRVGSAELKRAVSMLVSGIKRGASLSDVLEAISMDIRETRRIERERAATTMMQAMFILVASAVAAPAAIGIITSITKLFSAIGEVVYPVSEISKILLVYCGIQGFMSGLLIGVIRYGKPQRGLGYAIPIALAAIVIYTGVRIGFTKFLGI
ncbi:MAG: type II secretion system F family protein [Euryarchaeota archaeon]|nr:type II secretion system F family protein [Euryarchaeota archaeon]